MYLCRGRMCICIYDTRFDGWMDGYISTSWLAEGQEVRYIDHGSTGNIPYDIAESAYRSIDRLDLWTQDTVIS